MKNTDYGPSPQVGNEKKTGRFSWAQYILEAALAVFSVSWLLVVLRAVPFLTFPSMGISLMDSGLGALLSRDGFSPALDSIGLPSGMKLYMNLPYYYLQGVISGILDLSAAEAYLVTGALALTAGYVLGFLLCRKFDLPPYTRCLFPLLFLGNAMIIGQRSYGYQMYAFALLPAMIYLFLLAFDRLLPRKSSGKWATLLISLFCIEIFAVFINGYLFMVTNAILVFLVVYYAFYKLKGLRPRLVFTSVYCLSTAAAAWTYMLYIGSSSFWQPPISFFRASGADVSTLLIPTRDMYWFWDVLGLAIRRTTEMFYGDGSAFAPNFIGIIAIPALLCLFTQRNRNLKKVLLAGLCLTLFLSLGPSLKFFSHRIDADTSALNYNMPPEAASIEKIMPDMFYRLPGIKDFRVVSRWMLAVNFFAWILALLWFSELKNRKWGRAGSLILVLFLLVTEMPHAVNGYNLSRDLHKRVNKLEQDIVLPLREHVPKEARCLFVPFPQPSGNDYLSSFLAAEANLSVYNAVTDKGIVYCYQHWPVLVREVLRNMDLDGETRLKYALELLTPGEVDYLIFTFFDLRWDAYNWPPRKETVEQNRNAFRNTLTKVAPGSGRYETLFFDVVYLKSENKPDANGELLNSAGGQLN
ncbi:MAG: hypothetical protein ABIJ42_01810 [Acidobacteriota bacterium]